MRLLVVEENEIVCRIYKKIFKQRNYEVDYVKNEIECIVHFNEMSDSKNYDIVVLEKSKVLPDGERVEDKIREMAPSQKILFLLPYIDANASCSSQIGPNEHGKTKQNANSSWNEAQLTKTTREIIEKPFAMLALVAQIENKHKNRIILSKF